MLPTITIRFSCIHHYCVVNAYVCGKCIYHREAPKTEMQDRLAWLQAAKTAAFAWVRADLVSVSR